MGLLAAAAAAACVPVALLYLLVSLSAFAVRAAVPGGLIDAHLGLGLLGGIRLRPLSSPPASEHAQHSHFAGFAGCCSPVAISKLIAHFICAFICIFSHTAAVAVVAAVAVQFSTPVQLQLQLGKA